MRLNIVAIMLRGLAHFLHCPLETDRARGPRPLRTREEWDKWYTLPDPWGTEDSDQDFVRRDILLDRLKYARFSNLLDLGCGEGRLTAALSRVAENVYGIDISTKALERAKSRFPHIRFRQGEILDVIQDPEILRTPFDFISLAEVLYYFQTDDERRRVLAGLARVGAPACLYYFSVIVTGSSKYRRYFTHDEFVRMVSEHFQIVDCFGSIADLPFLWRLVRFLPSRRGRQALIRAFTMSRKPEQCSHVGYFALKRVGVNFPHGGPAVSAGSDRGVLG